MSTVKPGLSAIEVQTSTATMALLEYAAASSRKNVAEFLLEAGISAAEDAVLNQRMIRLNDEQWQAFQDILDRPVTSKPRLARLLQEKSVLEQ